MNLSNEETLVLAMTINPSVEYYFQQSNQPFATNRDREFFKVLRAIQLKLDAAVDFSGE
jgi:hypothetical protein